MEARQIIVGFSDIKSELIAAKKIKKAISELDVKFSLDDGFLCVHDSDEYNNSKVIAFYNKNLKTWRYFLKTGTHGLQLVQEVTNNYPYNLVLKKLEDLYESHGFRSFRRF